METAFFHGHLVIIYSVLSGTSPALQWTSAEWPEMLTLTIKKPSFRGEKMRIAEIYQQKHYDKTVKYLYRNICRKVDMCST